MAVLPPVSVFKSHFNGDYPKTNNPAYPQGGGKGTQSSTEVKSADYVIAPPIPPITSSTSITVPKSFQKIFQNRFVQARSVEDWYIIKLLFNYTHVSIVCV
jgi:hypothetical protein